jgi:hypothetical protein
VQTALQSACTASAAIRPLPDFLIIGGQRCGSTALNGHLARHPSIGAARVKEVHYFDLHYDRGEGWYRGHFPNDARRALARRRTGVEIMCGEATPYYLFHPLVPGRAQRLVGDAKLIALLRDPVARAVSHYHHEVALGREHLSFKDALDREPERLDGEEERMIGSTGYVSVAHQRHSYFARGAYATQLERWFEHFPRDRMLVIRSEDFFANPSQVVGDVLRFLGLPPMPPMRPIPPAVARGIRNARTYEPIAAETNARLTEAFREPNSRLARLLGTEPWWG